MLRRELACFFGALRFFTRLPVPAWVGHSAEGLGAAVRYLPAVGVLVGAAAAATYLAAALLWPKSIAVLLAMAVPIYLTGAFHEDGLADTVDGLGGGWEKSRILAIMKDSRVGSYGVVALVLSLLAQFCLLLALDEAWLPAALVAGHAFSRLAAISLMSVLDYVRADDSAKSRPLSARLSPAGFCFAALWAAPPLFCLPWPAALAACVLAAAPAWWLGRLCQRWLGGYTGDCLGAVQQLGALAFYLGLLMRWPVGSA